MSPPTPLLIALLLAPAVSLALIGEYLPQARPLRYIFKPVATTILVAWALSLCVAHGGRAPWAILAGLVFSLAGDILLMFERRFRDGLVAFLSAHLFYLIAFTTSAALMESWLPLFPWLAAGLGILMVLWRGIPPGLRIPVVVYMTVLMCMSAQASVVAIVRPGPASLMAAAGAGLFVLSDAVLALDRFRKPWKGARIAVFATYFAAQWLLTASLWRVLT